MHLDIYQRIDYADETEPVAGDGDLRLAATSLALRAARRAPGTPTCVPSPTRAGCAAFACGTSAAPWRTPHRPWWVHFGGVTLTGASSGRGPSLCRPLQAKLQRAILRGARLAVRFQGAI